jgi:DNA-binding transcriptional LysR family regulator
MDIQQLRYFVEVAQQLHFGRAADNLHVTPSPLSRRIRELERELGVTLLIRGYHEVQLTDAGQALLTPARDVLAQFDDIKNIARDHSGSVAPSLRVGASPLTPPHSLDFLLETLRGVDADPIGAVVLEPSAPLLRRLANCELDIAVVHLPVEEFGISSLSVMEYSWLLAVRADDELAGRSSVTLADVVDHEYIMSSAKVHPLAMNQLRDFVLRAGVKNVREMDSSDAATVAAWVARTKAFALTVSDDNVPGRRIYDDPRYSLIPLDEPNLHFRVGIAWRDQRYHDDPTLRQVIEAIRSRLPAPTRANVDA